MYEPVGTEAEAFATDERLAVTPLMVGTVPNTLADTKDVCDDDGVVDAAVTDTVV